MQPPTNKGHHSKGTIKNQQSVNLINQLIISCTQSSYQLQKIHKFLLQLYCTGVQCCAVYVVYGYMLPTDLATSQVMYSLVKMSVVWPNTTIRRGSNTPYSIAAMRAMNISIQSNHVAN